MVKPKGPKTRRIYANKKNRYYRRGEALGFGKYLSSITVPEASVSNTDAVYTPWSLKQVPSCGFTWTFTKDGEFPPAAINAQYSSSTDPLPRENLLTLPITDERATFSDAPGLAGSLPLRPGTTLRFNEIDVSAASERQVGTFYACTLPSCSNPGLSPPTCTEGDPPDLSNCDKNEYYEAPNWCSGGYCGTVNPPCDDKGGTPQCCKSNDAGIADSDSAQYAGFRQGGSLRTQMPRDRSSGIMLPK